MPLQTDEDFLRLALVEAYLAREGGEDPFGAVIVEAGQTVARSGSRELELGDPHAHAEVLAIRAACRILDTVTLRGCTLYSSTEPCLMCSGALKWAGIDRVVFSVPQRVLQTLSGGLRKPSCAELVNTGNRQIEVVGELLLEEGLAVLAGHFFLSKAQRYAARRR